MSIFFCEGCGKYIDSDEFGIFEQVVDGVTFEVCEDCND